MLFELPEGQPWRRVSTHILRAVNGRVATKADSIVQVLSVRDIRLSGDTLIATLVKEVRERCENGKWQHTGTEYEARTQRVYGGGWTRLELVAGATWDGWCLQTPQVERPTAGLLSYRKAGSWR